MTSFSLVNSRPGVQFRTNIIDVLPEPLTNHAIAYLFVSVPGSAWDATENDYSELEPLTPTIVFSLEDYRNKIGGRVPSPLTEYPAFISYKAVEKFFEGSNGSGVLYVIRTAVTPCVKLDLGYDDLADETGTALHFILKIDGVYYGSVDVGVLDTEGVKVYAISTTGLGLEDNTYDIKAALETNSFFADNYEIISDEENLAQGTLNIYAKTFGVIPEVEQFKIPVATITGTGYNAVTTPGLLSSDLTEYASAGRITKITNNREISFRLKTKEKIYTVAGKEFNDDYYSELDTDGAFTNFPNSAIDPAKFSALVNKYLIDKGYFSANSTEVNLPGYPTINFTPNGTYETYIVVTRETGIGAVTETSGTPLVTRNLSTSSLSFYRAVETAGVITWTQVSNPVQTIEPVQTFAVNVGSPTDRYSITSNGANAAQHAATLLSKLVQAIDDSRYTLTYKNTVITGSDTLSAAIYGTSNLPPTVYSNGLNSWDRVVTFALESESTVAKYFWGGLDSRGNAETDVFNVIEDNFETPIPNPRSQDYVYAIANSLNDASLLPGFVLCPEAYARYSSAKSSASSSELQKERLRISSALVAIARKRNWFALVDDNPDATNISQSSTEFNSITNTVPSAGGHFGFYFPYLVDFDNNQIPASVGAIAVALSRYTNDGFRQPPAGIDYPIAGYLKPKYPVNASQQEIYSPKGMNPIVAIANSGLVIYGSRTTATSTPVQFVNSRIIANVALQSLKNSFNGFVFNALETNNQAVFGRITTTAIGILQELYDAGALIGETPNDAYVVICDERNNRPSNLAQGIVYCFIEFAPATTLERLVISINVTSAGQVGAFITNI